MSKLYVFGIGGTGSRVLRSLTMLLAAGVECKVDTIVPIIIDPDDSAADLTRTVELMRSYEIIRNKLEFTSSTENNFYSTEITQSIQNYRLPLTNTRDIQFKDYIDIESLSDSNRALANMLFSEKNLESSMKVGFKGNPNIGSVVLHQFKDSQEFKDFGNDFQQGDRIFIISSIFGGTGASGFPLLAKELRYNTDIPNYALVNKAQIGAVTVMPYFGVKQDDNSEIDSGTFISKTKSALSYYNDNISNNETVNALYYIADNIRNVYDNSEGGITQKNNAHLVEFLSALSIIDFVGKDFNEGITHKEFGLQNDAQEVTFKDFGAVTSKLLQKPLTQFVLFSKYIESEIDEQYKHQPWAKNIRFDSSFIDSHFFETIDEFLEEFINWLSEMDDNKRSLSLFELSINNNRLFEIVKGITPKSLMTFKSNYALFDDKLNAQKIPSSSGKEQQFIELFYRATSELVEKKFNF